MKMFTEHDLTKVLNISKATITDLVNAGLIPYKRIEDTIRFCPDSIGRWMAGKPVFSMDHNKYLERYRKRLLEKAPESMAAITEYGKQFAEPWEPKLFYLSKVKSKKHGFIYYVRYLENGSMVPSNWTTGTNNKEAAERWAVENRERLLNGYFNRDTVKKPYGEMYSVLRKYYAENSSYLEIDANRGKSITEKTRRHYHNFIIKQFIPYLKKNRIKDFVEIDTPFLSNYQDYLMADKKVKGEIIPGVKPSTLKIYLLTISQIFNHLLQKGHVKSNPYKSLTKIKIDDELQTGCYEIKKLKGVFNKKWESDLTYLLCLIIYTANMRNSEIERVRVRDLIKIGKVNFIDINDSKTPNGIRIVPLHDFVYRKIMAYVKKNGKKEGELIFKKETTKKIQSKTYTKAYMELAGHIGYTPEKIKEENIKFYSGRHFWKTLMDSEGLGDIEEYFMGHKVSADLKKRYNHKDKQGQKKLLQRARKLFSILDKYVFR